MPPHPIEMFGSYKSFENLNDPESKSSSASSSASESSISSSSSTNETDSSFEKESGSCGDGDEFDNEALMSVGIQQDRLFSSFFVI